MSKIDTVRAAMVTAMKEKDKPRKDACSMLLSVLKNAAIDARRDLTEEEENAVVLKEIKQTQETLETTPADREEIRNQCLYRISVYQEFAPRLMDETEIRAEIHAVLELLEISAPGPKDKGRIMKELMPRVKGRADGKLVSQVLAEMMA